MEHALQLKKLAKETEELKVEKFKEMKVLKEKTNCLDHQRKLQTIEFTAKRRQEGKENDMKRRQSAKQTKFQGGSDQMGLLHGKLKKQAAGNGGCIPNPGTTPIPLVSCDRVSDGIYFKVSNNYPFLYTMLLFYTDGRTTRHPTERDAAAPCGSILVPSDDDDSGVSKIS
jgi:hypothetical protein